MSRVAAAVATAICLTLCAPSIGAQSDLDQFMQRVVSRRDDNWKKLQQYILDERESFEMRGQSGAPIWGDQRDYTWFIRDGFFVRSPVRANGVALPEADRRKYEEDFLKEERQRDDRARARGGQPPPDAPTDLNSLIQQTRAPRFVSSAYFLRFQFDAGKYALVGREPLEGRTVYRVEYYPSNLFRQDRRGPGRLGENPVDTETRRLLNKVAVVTLWIDPSSAQILRYTFDNVALDFLPAQWLIHVEDVTATMTMGEMFPDVWLPRDVSINVGAAFAVGEITVQYHLAYSNYRRAEATSTLRTP
jgi:hypothetical protein